MAVAVPSQTVRSTRAAAPLRGSLALRMLRCTALAGLTALAPALSGDLVSTSAHAQSGTLETLGATVDQSEPLLLEADELRYDFDRDLISANGDVQIYYGGNTVEANQVEFDRKQNRLRANGNVRLTEPNGNVLRASSMELSEDLRDGFVAALQLDTPQRTRFIADGARRENGNRTTFDNGIYTVYTRPTSPPGKPPLWRVRAATIVHDETERTVEFRDASLEFFGRSLVYLPYFSMADPTVKRKTGLLTPSAVVGDRVGVGVTVPYYFALDPNYDLLLSATPLSKQGLLTQAEWRQRLIDGSYSINVGGLIQARPGEYGTSSGNRRFRGVIATEGAFEINQRWKWGWDLSYRSDRAFLNDYSFADFGNASDISQIYLTGQSERNRFDLRSYAFRVSQEDYAAAATFNDPNYLPVGSRLQDKQPFVHPVLDYNYIFEDPIAGGELSLTGNLTSLTRDQTDAIRVGGTTRFRGVEGTFTRTSLRADWRTTVIDPLGQVFTPFAYVKGDLFFLASQDKTVGALTDESVVGRIMPAVGIDYRFPILGTFNGGNQIFEPVAQLIVRPNEGRIGELPNEDAQSIVFDSTTLFEYDKFSGFDRSEGGTRANIGLKYSLQFDNSFSMNALIGRSFQLAGTNSFKTADILDATRSSGLASDQSDYVSSLYFDSRQGFRIGAQARFDHDNFAVRRAQVEASGIYGPVTGNLAYAYLSAQPNIGIPTDREEVIGSASLRLQENWRVFGSVRYDLQSNNMVRDSVGFGYDDEGFSVSFAYSEDRSRNNGQTTDRLFFLRFGLRTLGDTQFSTNGNN
ncbi:LPS-assembly protein LptD [Stappia sp. ES.058]|uniref:LPS-assembly protein LptD n=1 Tax=Stappia sp. ES.058 TaxID=1881061 RepID=UPI00087DD1E6|nr:LPS-assembly protein LptD [Stappia sp. ES.058]SDU16651.1 LPS-assembly protein [Stappia sp. ES.058]